MVARGVPMEEKEAESADSERLCEGVSPDDEPCNCSATVHCATHRRTTCCTWSGIHARCPLEKRAARHSVPVHRSGSGQCHFWHSAYTFNLHSAMSVNSGRTIVKSSIPCGISRLLPVGSESSEFQISCRRLLWHRLTFISSRISSSTTDFPRGNGGGL
jgi:hypothetical protein